MRNCPGLAEETVVGHTPEGILAGRYDWAMVALSVIIAVCASFTALYLAGRISAYRGGWRTFWLVSGGTALGIGIWSMHYIGMLAFQLPVPVLYDIPRVVFSLFTGIAASTCALWVVSHKDLKAARLTLGSGAMGLGISLMHYSGMNAMRLDASMDYDPALVALSIVVAVSVSFAALLIAFRLRNDDPKVFPKRLLGAACMGVAIAAMHYTGMAAVHFRTGAGMADMGTALPVTTLGAAVIAVVTFGILVLTLAGALADRHLSQQREELRWEQERWALVLKANHDGLYDVNLETKDAFYSPRWVGMLGFKAGELSMTEESWKSRIHPQDIETVEEALDNYLTRRSPSYDLEYRMRHRDGQWIWVHSRAQAVWDESGRAMRLVGSHADVTRRKQTEVEWRASEARFKTFVDNNPIVTFIKDEDGRLVYTNRALERTFGVPHGGWIGKADSDLFSSDIAAKMRQVDMSVLVSDQIIEVVETLPMVDGTLRRFLSTKFSFEDSSGRRALGGMSIDVTERMQVDDAVRDSEARYRELFERNPLPCWLYDIRDLCIHDANDAAIAHFGWSKDELLGMSLRDLQIPGETEQIEQELKQSLGAHEATKPWRHRGKNGRITQMSLMGFDVKATGYPARMLMANDVTEKLESERKVKEAYDRLETLVESRTAALRASELQWRGLIESTPHMVWTVNGEGAVSFLNNRVSEETGIPYGEVTTEKFRDLLHPADRDRILGRWSLAVRTESSVDFEFRLKHVSGSYRWFRSLAAPIRDTTGKVVQWVGTTTNIDEQKQSEELLEGAVAQRTAELADAVGRAESAALAKSEFLAAMSHEIRTPMNGVIGMTTLMFETPLNSEQRCYMDAIRSSGQALLTVINDILDFSKIEAGKLELEAIAFDLQSVIEEAVDLSSTAASAKGIAMALHIDESIRLDVLGDPGRLRQILLNLLSNAVKFTEHGSVSVTVTREGTLNSLSFLRFAIKDTGIGLTRDQQNGLFQAFQQADRSTTRRFGGTGLGLAISKRLAEAMGGSIGVASEPGRGSTFWFSVCLAAGPDLVPPELLAGKTAGVLCSAPVAAEIRRDLERVGMTVRDVARGEADKNGGSHFDVFFVGSAGLRSWRELETARAELNLGDTPVVFVGSSHDWHDEPPENPKIATYLPKPVRRWPLLNALRSALDGGHEAGISDFSKQPVAANRGNVLLVEDNKINQIISRVMIEKLGYTIMIAENGVAAVSAFETETFDLILMDCRMPEMDGFEATQRIRALEKGHRTPIIALTAGVLPEERTRCYQSGMDDFLSKPISQQDLENVFERWMEASKETGQRNHPPVYFGRAKAITESE